MNDFGFIITRHVNSELTNRYWNQCVKLIRTFYPFKKLLLLTIIVTHNLLKPNFHIKI